ncbi:hypothetical protein [Micromonospora sp. NPDC049497]|uniref:hypothetical protein n=1 Tax=Micromonospora sp. NPDC049497 TaxID=3364273 RepID=UPI00378C7BEC
MPVAAAEAVERTSSAPPPRRRGWIPRWRHLPLAALLGAYLAARVRILTGFTVFTSPDAGSYAARSGNPIETLSFTGHAPRPWGVPLLYAMVDTDPARVVLQWTISTLAWSLLVCACWLLLRSLPVRVFAAAALICLALSRSVYPWDHAILSESLSISLGIAALALLAIWVRTRSRVAITALVLVAFWWTFTRQDVLPYVLLLVVVLAGYVLLRRYRWAAATATVVLLGGLAWQAAIVPTVDHSYRSWGTGVSLSEATFLYRLRFQVLNDPQVKSAYQQEFGMPRCERAELLAKGRSGAMGEFIVAYRDCPALMDWVQREKGSVGYRYALAHPKHYADTVLKLLPTSLGGTVRYAKPVPGVPTFPERVFFPQPDRVLPQAGLIFLVTLGAGLLARAFRGARLLAVAGTLVVLASMGSAVAGTMYSAGEYSRFGIQEAVLLRVGLVLLAAAAIQAVVASVTDRVAALRRRRAPAATPAPGEAPAASEAPAATDLARDEPAFAQGPRPHRRR